MVALARVVFTSREHVIALEPRGFQPAGAPVDPVMGSFTITLDPTVDTSFATTITFNNVNITPGANAPFFFYVANSSGGSSYCVLTRFSC
jgi:hypothetical protein